MENKLVSIFIVSLFITLILVRAGSFIFHDLENYGTPEENSRTLTGVLRKNLNIDLHHIHLGLIFLGVLIPLLALKFINPLSIILSGISSSLILDQIFSLIGFGNYFSPFMTISSIFIHLIFAEIILVLKIKIS